MKNYLKMSEEIISFCSEYKLYAESHKNRTNEELKIFANTLSEYDSLFVGSEFLNLFSHSREEDLSDKFAWFLSLTFLRNKNTQTRIRNQIINGLIKSSPNYLSHIEDKELIFSSSLEIKREYSLSSKRKDETMPRLDLLLIDHDQKIVLGIEVKSGDESLKKSEEDCNLLKKEFPNYHASFFLIMPEYQLKPNNEDKQEEVLNIPFCTWESLVGILRNLHAEKNAEQVFIIMSQFFIGSLESEKSVMNYDTEKIAQAISDGVGSILDIGMINNYLAYRKKTEG